MPHHSTPPESRTILLHDRGQLPTSAAPAPADTVLLLDRLDEELQTATRRRATTHGAQLDALDRGLVLLHHLIDDIEHGRRLDPTTEQLLSLSLRESA